MRSAAKLSYGQAQGAIDGRPDDTTGPLLEPVLKPLWAAYARRETGARYARTACPRSAGAQDRAERRTAPSTACFVPERLDAHRLIEEFMILANVAAAETLEQAGSPLDLSGA